MRDNQTLKKYATQQKEDRERQARRDAYATSILPQIMSEIRSWDTCEMNRIAGICYTMADAMENARLSVSVASK